MKSAIIKAPGNLVIEDVPKPKCGNDEILVKIKAASICNETDWLIYKGCSPFQRPYPEYDWFPTYPHALGHESMGEIVEVGKNVKGYSPGERICYWCVITGAFSEYIAFNPANFAVVKLSDNISDVEGALIEPVIGTMRCCLAGGVRAGQNVAVFGQGCMGQLLMQEAKILGANKVAVTDISDFRLQKAKELGADCAVNVKGKTADEIANEVKETVGEIDLVIDAIGDDLTENGTSVDAGVEMLKLKGEYFIYGYPKERRSFDLTRFAMKFVRLYMDGLELEYSQRAAALGQQFVSDGRLKLKPLITHVLPLEKLEKGLHLCAENMDETIKVVIEMPHL